MSYWTHILGVIKVSPIGRTQHEKTYILNTVLDHLPLVTGSERNMDVLVNVDPHHDCSSSHDELGFRTNNLTDCYGDRTRRHGMLRTSGNYYLTIFGDFRDRMFNQTFREFEKWLCRLSKRVYVDEVNVTITADDRRKPYHILENRWDNPYEKMFEDPSWCASSDGEPNWCEYLMWEGDRYSGLPIQYEYKYYENEDIDREMERRREFAEMRGKKLDYGN